MTKWVTYACYGASYDVVECETFSRNRYGVTDCDLLVQPDVAPDTSAPVAPRSDGMTKHTVSCQGEDLGLFEPHLKHKWLHVATITPASDADACAVMTKPPIGDDNRSGWSGCDLPAATLFWASFRKETPTSMSSKHWGFDQ